MGLMFFYIYQTCTLSFPIGLVKAEAYVIARSFEASLGRRMLVVVVPPDSMETKLANSDQKASPLAGKNTRILLALCSGMEVHPYSYFWWCGFMKKINWSLTNINRYLTDIENHFVKNRWYQLSIGLSIGLYQLYWLNICLLRFLP